MTGRADATAGVVRDGRESLERHIPPSAAWAQAQATLGGYQGRRRQLSARREGLEQVNTFCLSLRNVKLNGKYPTYDKIHDFSSGTVKLNIRKVKSITSQRAKQRILISFMSEMDVNSFETLINSGVQFPGTRVKVDGFRMDDPTVLVKMVGAPWWVEWADVKSLFERWGTFVSAERGTHGLSSPEGIEGEFGSGWIWDGIWRVKIKSNKDINLPNFILACGDVWDLRMDDSPNLCFKCGFPGHMAGQSPV